jgi:hypothetical protein
MDLRLWSSYFVREHIKFDVLPLEMTAIKIFLKLSSPSQKTSLTQVLKGGIMESPQAG